MSFKNWSISKKIHIPLISSILLGFIIVFIVSYYSVINIENKVYKQSTKALKNIFSEKLQAKKDVGITNAIAIAHNSDIIKALKTNNRELALKELKDLDDVYRMDTKFKNIKIHLHTKDLYSFLRVWNPSKYGDYLGDFRKTLVWVKKHKKSLIAIEIGRAGLVLRGISPVMEKNEYLGSVEFMQGLNSISKDLLKKDIYVMIVMKKEYLNIATFLKDNLVIGDYVVALKNGAYSKEYLDDLKTTKLNKDVIKTKNFFAVRMPIRDFSKNIVGYAIIAESKKSLDSVIKSSILALIKQMIVMFLIDVLLLTLLIVLISRTIIKPIKKLREGLESFFNYLKNPSLDIKPIEIDTNDEFGEIADFANEGIKISARLHAELLNLMNTIDENVIICETDKDGFIVNITKAFCKVSGYTKEELIGMNYNDLIYPDAEITLVNKIWETIKSGQIYKGEIKVLKKDGSYFWMSFVMSEQCKDVDCRYVAIGYDITDKKKVEELSKNLEIKIMERTKDLLLAKREIEKIHKHTKESIEFASLLQNALLPEKSLIDSFFKDEFIIWKPKDIVGGDIYLFEMLRNKNECVLMVIDCTGHGVPGAFVTMIVKAVEREIVSHILEDKSIEVSPAWILSYFNKTIKKLLKQDKDSLSNAGFDGGVIYYDKSKQILKFAGANTPLFYVDDEVKMLKGNRYSVGYKQCDINYKYKEYVLEVKEGMKFYLSTDGFLDQNGGEKGFPFGKKRFKKLIEEYHSLEMSKQKEKFLEAFNHYKKKEEQNDDVTVVAFEIDKKSEIKVIVEYDGMLTQPIISHTLEIIEYNIKNLSVLSKLSTAIVEIMQNMMKYAKSSQAGSKEIVPKGYIKVSQIENRYIIDAKNIISKEDKAKILPILEEIDSLDEKEIKKRYRELRRSGDNTHEKGGGIGFFEIAKLGKIKYNFISINEDKYYFEMSVFIETKREKK